MQDAIEASELEEDGHLVVQTKPESPCIRRCTLDPETDICVGCYRYLQEIIGWSEYSAEQRLEVLGKLAKRKNEYALKRAMPRSQNK